MAFFPRNYYNGSDASFTPLFRLLDDFDNYSRQSEGQGGRASNGNRGSSSIAFQPKFDVRELENHFELHGELPGLSKEHVNIEFTDPHTLRIHGRVERTYTSGTPPAGLLQGGSNEMSGAINDGEDNKPKDHQPTVEDEQEEGNQSISASSSSEQSVEKKSSAAANKQPRDRAKYWCTERSIGEFSRSFNFPGQIQQDAVSASLKDGVLNITVPKAPKHEARRIAIN